MDLSYAHTYTYACYRLRDANGVRFPLPRTWRWQRCCWKQLDFNKNQTVSFPPSQYMQIYSNALDRGKTNPIYCYNYTDIDYFIYIYFIWATQTCIFTIFQRFRKTNIRYSSVCCIFKYWINSNFFLLFF